MERSIVDVARYHGFEDFDESAVQRLSCAMANYMEGLCNHIRMERYDIRVVKNRCNWLHAAIVTLLRVGRFTIKPKRGLLGLLNLYNDTYRKCLGSPLAPHDKTTERAVGFTAGILEAQALFSLLSQPMTATAMDSYGRGYSPIDETPRSIAFSAEGSLPAQKHRQEYPRSPVHIEQVVRAVADSLCALDGVSRKMNEETGEYRSTACDRLQREGIATAKAVNVPKDFAKLMVKVFSDDSIRRNTIENRIDAYSILFAMLCHVQDAVKKFPEVIIASLSLITDPDEEVRKDYEWTFKVIVSMNPSEKLIVAIQDAFVVDDDALTSSQEEQRLFESSAPFLAYCASEGHDVKFRQWAREMMYARALQITASHYLTQLAHQLHISEAKKEPEIGGDPRRFFVRQTRTLTKMLSVELLSTVNDWCKNKEQYSAAVWTKEVNQDCDLVLTTAAYIWGFDGIQSFLRAFASRLIVEYIVVDLPSHPAATAVIERVRVHLDRDPRSLIEECVPSIVERIIRNSADQTSCESTESEADLVESIFMTLVHNLHRSKAMHVQSERERADKKEQTLLLKAGDPAMQEEGWCG